MFVKIDQDHSRFKQIIRGKIKQELRKFITRGELIGRQGKDLVSIPLPQIEIPHFAYGPRQMGGVGQGEGKPGDIIGVGEVEGDGKSQAGNEEGEHLLEVDVPLDELVDIMGEELELPRIQPKGAANLQSQKDRYVGVGVAGPESLRHFKRTYRQALRRQILMGNYDPTNPRVVPVREDRRYRVWKREVKPERNAVIIYMMDVSGCHTEGHYVEMADGSYKDVKDIQEGNLVCSIDLASHEKKHGLVTQKFSFETSEIVKVVTEDHVSLSVTPEHRYFVYQESEGKIDEKKASELQEGDSLILVNQCGGGALDSDLEVTLTEAEAYLLGVVLGDGHVVDHEDPEDSKKNSRYVAITDENEARLSYYADCAATAFGLRGIIRQDANSRKRLYLNSVHWVQWIKAYFPSLTCRSRYRYVEPRLFRQSGPVRAAFLSGLFDAEGTLSRHAVELISSSLELVKQVKLLLSYWRIRARIQEFVQADRQIQGQELKSGTFYRLSINSKDALLFRDHIGFRCRDKGKKLVALCDQQEEGIDAMRSRYVSREDVKELFRNVPSIEKIKSRLYEEERRCFSFSNLKRLREVAVSEEQRKVVDGITNRSLLLCRVKEVKKRAVSPVKVYDFEVADYHNYIVDGVLSHNSMGAEQKEIVRIETFWIDTWIRAHYKGLEVRYIVHDAVAREVDRDTFYRTKESGGTIISSAYKYGLDLIHHHYLPADWNIYAFHFSDGDNWSGNDTQECLKLLEEQILPSVNLFGYGQVESEYGSGQFLRDLTEKFPSHEALITSKIASRDAIFDSIKQFLGKGK